MAKRLKNVEKVAAGLNSLAEFLGDRSGSFVSIENNTHSVCISFDGKGDEFTGILICEKIYKVVDEKIIARFDTE